MNINSLKSLLLVVVLVILQENIAAFRSRIYTPFQNESRINLWNKSRNSKYLFPFAVVNFPPEPCSPTNTQQLEGVCLSKKRCSASVGESVGSCQQGYGTCCKFSKQCQATRRSVPVVETVENLMSSSLAGTCEFAFPRQQGICQIKLDFVNVILQEAQTVGPNAGNCQTESITVSGAANLNGPLKVCGRLTGQHMILSYGSTSDLISVMVHSEMISAVYNIRATQIPCNSVHKAPDDCLQYYTSTSAAVKSFGYPRQLNNQKYTICVRPNSGGSILSWDRCLDNDAEGVLLANRFRVSSQARTCIMDYIAIDADKRCGLTFAPLMTGLSSHVRVRVNFDESETGNDIFTPTLPDIPPSPPKDVCEQFSIPNPAFSGPPGGGVGTPKLCNYLTTGVCQCIFSNMPDPLAQTLKINVPVGSQSAVVCPRIPGYTAEPERLQAGMTECMYYANIRVTDTNNTGFCLRYQVV